MSKGRKQTGTAEDTSKWCLEAHQRRENDGRRHTIAKQRRRKKHQVEEKNVF
jgi:hypothetical protein